MPYLSIIIPAYNEAERIAKTLTSIQEYIERTKTDAEVIVVDDGSHDATADIVTSFKEKIPSLIFHPLTHNKGKGYAVKTGMLLSSGIHVLFMDADSSTPISEFDKLVPFFDTYDIVIGSRALNRDSENFYKPLYRKIITGIGRRVVHYLLTPGIKDTQCGFKAFKGDQARIIAERLRINRFGFDIEILIIAQKLKYKIHEVPVQWQHAEKSKFHPFIDTFRTAIEILLIKFRM